jgi:hypothetical protein
VFPDVLAFGPSFAAGLWLLLTRGRAAAPAEGHFLPHIHVGLPLYQLGHSLLAFLLVFVVVGIVSRRVMPALLGWLLHIAIDIPTHSLTYHATRFLWPVSEYRIDGLPWWTPWFWVTTYAVLAVVYLRLWHNGSISALRRHRRRCSDARDGEYTEVDLGG